jgi:STAM-binding protein
MEGTRKHLSRECEPLSRSDLASISLSKLFHIAKQLCQQARLEEKQSASFDSLCRRYVYLKRFLVLVLETIPKHAKYDSAEYRADRNWAKAEAQRCLESLESIAALIDAADEESKRATERAEADAREAQASKTRDDGPAMEETTFDVPESAMVAQQDDAPPDLDLRTAMSILSADPNHSADVGLKASSLASTYPAVRPLSFMAGEKAVTEVPSLRTVEIPSRFPTIFEKVASPNTARDVETCGILAGKIVRNRLRMTHLIIPMQSGTANTCCTCNEEDVFNYMLEKQIVNLGWVHTHPSQTCFLSSVDLHTGASYQLLLAEALSIVIAPTDAAKRVGVFRLSPGGLRVIQQCVETGFHTHENSGNELYGDACVEWMDEEEDVELVDLRVVPS